MRDMLPRKQTASVTEIKKGLKELYGNGMNAGSASPALISPAASGGSDSPVQDEGLNMKTSSDSPHVLMKNSDDNIINSSNCISSLLPKPLTSSIATTTTAAPIVTSPISSPGILPINRTKPSPKQNKTRRNQSSDSKHKNQIFDFKNQSANENFCANNNNNSKALEKINFSHRRKLEEQTRTSRTPSTNSISDELSSSGMTSTTDEQTNALTPEQDNFEDDMLEAMKIIDKVHSFPGPTDDLADFPNLDFVSTSESYLFESTQLRSTPTLDGADIIAGFPNSPTSNTKQSTVTTASTTLAMQLSAASLASSVSSPTYQGDSAKYTSSETRKPQLGKSHLQDILGVTDTKQLENMARPIDSVSYKSPTTTTSYSNSMKHHSTNPMPTPLNAMAPPNRLPISNMSYNKPRQHMFNDMFRPSSQGYNMDPGINGPWNRESPRQMPPNVMKPPFPSPSTISPTSMTPISQLQSTVESIPAAPMGTDMGPPPLRSPGFETTSSSPGGIRMRPPPSSPSVANDKRCVSADSVAANTTNGGKKVGIKRERTRSADSKEEDKKDASGPKTKRRKSKSKEDNGAKKESKTPTRASSKGDKMPALSKLLDVPSTDPYLYIFSTEHANEAAITVKSRKVPNIILFHQSFLGNCKLRPPESERPMTSETSTNIPMPTTSRSPTEIAQDKIDSAALKIEKTEIVTQNFPENVQAINLQDTKPKMLPPPVSDNHEQSTPMEMMTPQSGAPTFNGDQEELTDEKRRHREDKLGKLKRMQEMFQSTGDNSDNGNHGMRGAPGWGGSAPPVNYSPMGPPHMDKMNRPGMKEIARDGMLLQGQTPENADWLQMVQEHNDKRRIGRGMPGELPSRPPPPYDRQHPWPRPEGYPMELVNPRLHLVNQRPVMRLSQDQRMRFAHRMGGPRASFPSGPNSRMPLYDHPYMVQPGMRPSSRLPPPGLRQPSGSENYPFSEQLMKQARYYNSGGAPYEPEHGMVNPMGNEWGGSEGTQRLTHMPGAAGSPGLAPQSMINPMEMEPRLTPGVPNPRGYEMGPSFPPDMGYDMMHNALGSPTGPPDGRMRVPPGSMMDAIARRGGQRPPDLDLNSQIPPRSPMYQTQGPMPSPSLNPALGPRYPNPCDMGHPSQPSPMHGCPRSPMVMNQSMPMGPSSAGPVPPQMMTPLSAGPLGTPPPDWQGHNPNLTGTQTANSGMLHHMMTSQPGNMTSQPGMMSSQPGMRGMQPGMMTSPGMISQPGMATSQPPQGMMNPRMPNSQPQSTHPLSIMMNSINSFKMPERSSLYQDAVKDTGAASPPPLTHQNEPPPLTHNTMPGGMRMPGPNHPSMYDTRMGPPRMGNPQMNENFPYTGGHPSPMSNPAQIPSGGMPMNFHPDSMPPPSDYQPRPSFPDVPHDFDLRGILPSEKPSQTISYLPPDTNDRFQSPAGWGPEGIRPQLVPSNMYPPGPNSRPLI